MKKFLSRKRRFLTVLLALTGMAVTVAYAVVCLGSCSYLKGDILAIDLKYLGIFYMAVVLLLAWFRKTFLCFLLLAFGTGGEIFLIGYQVRAGIYCPYCLAFGATVLLAFALNFERNRKRWAALTVAAGFLFFLLFFSGSTTPAYAAEPVISAFGSGPVEVRLYTDYFCGPCAAEEAEVMTLVAECVDKNLARILFIDTPVHQETVLYAGFFLAALNAKKEFRQAIAARKALFEATEKKIKGQGPLEAFLKTKGLDVRPLDTTPHFKIFSHYLKEDKVNATPSCVIIGPTGKRTLVGQDEIAKGLRDLLR